MRADAEADLKGRNRGGEFTARYNRRRDVRSQRFQSVEVKRNSKSVGSMDVAKVSPAILARKCVAVLTLPFVTRNGETRTVNAPTGQALKTLCRFHYSQPTLAKFLAELKYLGISTDLLHHQVGFWQEIWRREAPEKENNGAIWKRNRLNVRAYRT